MPIESEARPLLAVMLRFARRLDGGTHTHRVKTALESEQTALEWRIGANARARELPRTQVQAAAEPVATAGMAFQELALAPAAQVPLRDSPLNARASERSM